VVDDDVAAEESDEVWADSAVKLYAKAQKIVVNRKLSEGKKSYGTVTALSFKRGFAALITGKSQVHKSARSTGALT
jgi:hypothetical protein